MQRRQNKVNEWLNKNVRQEARREDKEMEDRS